MLPTRTQPGASGAGLDRIPTKPCDESYVGTARIEAYTVMHDHNGPTPGPCSLLKPTGSRTWGAVTDLDPFPEMMATEAVGCTVELAPDGKINLI